MGRGDGVRSLLLALLFVGVPAACGGWDPPPPPFDLDAPLRAELGIPSEVTIHRITLGGRGATDHVVPLRTEAAPGDVLHVLSADRRIQTFTFVRSALPPGGAEFLERTRQDASPPLMEAGSSWVLSLDDAPEGEYPFVVQGHGDPVRGVLDIRRRR